MVLSNGNFVVTDDGYNSNNGAVYLYSPGRVLISRLTGTFGSMVGSGGITVLTNGNYVVSSPYWSSGTSYSQLSVGAVTWCSQVTGCNGTVSASNSLVGSSHADHVGGVTWGGVTALTNGNYVVSSPDWDSGSIVDAGAVTWGNGTGGTMGVVSASNSLVGSSEVDQVGSDFYGRVIALTNGNYVVSSPQWDNGSVVDAGAVTWGNGTGGTTGVVSVANSLVGSTLNDQVGNYFNGRVIELTNGNYLVQNSAWDNGSVIDAGAVTWGDGTSGTSGVVSASNSLVGSSPDDQVGDSSGFVSGVEELTNGNYVVSSQGWDLDGTHPDVGAVTWGNGTGGTMGVVSASNSLVGASADAPVGGGFGGDGVTALTNGNYVVNSPGWSPDGTASSFGAVTWGNGTTGVAGQISAANSLVGSSVGDYVGDEVIALTNGNYIVNSPNWYSADYRGAVTWGDGTSGITGPISASNSLVGGGTGVVVALTNGNYVVSSPNWYETPGPYNIGAVTWGDGTIGVTGMVSTTNSLVGNSGDDSVGGGGVEGGGLTALTNGNYVVHSPYWDNGSVIDAGAVTWGDGTSGTVGVVSAANSLVGSSLEDEVGGGLYGGGVTALTNGNYVVRSPYWDNGSVVDAGAVSWGNGTGGTAGMVSAANSLVGSSLDDQVGGDRSDGRVITLTNGNYLVSIPQWDNGGMTDAGAVAWGDGTSGTSGVVSASNSLVGSSLDDMVGDGSFGGATGLTALTNGDYVVNSPHWSSGIVVGAVTWGNGTSGTVGVVSDSNSLVNTSANDPVLCRSEITALPDGNASIYFKNWSNGSNYEAVSLIGGFPCNTVGPVSAANSVLGSTANVQNMVSDYDAGEPQLIVGRPWDNMVTILRCQADLTHWYYLPAVIK